MAAIALSQGAEAMGLLASTVKYAGRSEPLVAATAAYMAAELASAVNADEFARDILRQGDEAAGGRCPGILAALVARGGPGDNANLERLKSLFWDDWAAVPAGRNFWAYEYRIPQFDAYRKQCFRAHNEKSAASQKLVNQRMKLNAVLCKYVFECGNTRLKKALKTATRVNVGRWDVRMDEGLNRYAGKLGCPKAPTADNWGKSTDSSAAETAAVFRFVRWTSGRLRDDLASLATYVRPESGLTVDQRSVIGAALPLADACQTVCAEAQGFCDMSLISEAERAEAEHARLYRQPSGKPMLPLSTKIPALFSIPAARVTPAALHSL